MKKKSLLDNIVAISKKIKDLNYTIHLNRDTKRASLVLSSSLIWEELEPISDYCKLHDVSWEITIENNVLKIEVFENE